MKSTENTLALLAKKQAMEGRKTNEVKYTGITRESVGCDGSKD